MGVDKLPARLKKNWRKILKISAVVMAFFSFICLFAEGDVMEKITDVAIYAFGAVIFFVLAKADLSKVTPPDSPKHKTIAESWQEGIEQDKRKRAEKQAELLEKQPPRTKHEVELAPREPAENRARGLLFAMGAPIIGVILWLWLWSMDIMAGFVAWLIAFLVVKLYAIGAGKVSAKSADTLIWLIIDSIGLAFVSGLVASALKMYQSVYGVDMWSALASAKFWSTFILLITNPRFLTAIWQDIAFAVVFGFLGSYGYIKSLKEYTDEKPTS